MDKAEMQNLKPGDVIVPSQMQSLHLSERLDGRIIPSSSKSVMGGDRFVLAQEPELVGDAWKVAVAAQFRGAEVKPFRVFEPGMAEFFVSRPEQWRTLTQ